MKPVTKKQALEAIDSMDDFARMSSSVDAYGPRGLLLRYIGEREASRKLLERIKREKDAEIGVPI